MNNIKRWTMFLVAGLMVGSVSAQTLLYQWDFDNATGVGASLSVAPSYVDGLMTGGTLANISRVATVGTPAGSGVYGVADASDLGLVNSGAFRSTAGDMGTVAGDLSSINSFTIGLWFNLNATVTNYTAGGSTLFSAGNPLLSRLVNISTGGVDGNELYFAFNGANLQFGVNKNGTGMTSAGSPLTPLGLTSMTITNTWIFLAAAYTTAAGGTVNYYAGTTASNAVLAGTTTAVGTIAWSSNTNLITIGNTGNSGANRSLPGSIDNVSFYSGALTLAQIISLQTNVALAADVPTAGVPVVAPSNIIFLGSSLTITSAFGGAAPLALQWQTDGGGGVLTNIPGATNSSLATTPPKTGTFQYDLVVTNISGSATGAVAVVTVKPLPGTANVSINVAGNLATVAGAAYGMGTAIYDNQNGNSALPNLLIQSGVNTLRYPGGGLAEYFHWSVSNPGSSLKGKGLTPDATGTNYGYMGSQTDFGHFVSLLTNSHCQAVITLNYGSGLQWGAGHTSLVSPATNAEPPEAAAWVAYANANTNIFGTANDVALGVDSLGNDWKTAGYWARLRAAAPLGVDDGYNFLRIGRQNPIGIKYWEVGNEQFGTGYDAPTGNGYALCYTVPYPYTVYPRYGNPSLSPEFYGQKVRQFSLLMKAVDPTIKVGAVATENASWNYYTFNGPGVYWTPEVLAQCATNIDFIINHSYPYAGNLDDGGDLLAGVGTGLPVSINGTGDHTGLNEGLRDMINHARTDGTNCEIIITEFGYTGSLTNALNGESVAGPVNALFCADSYVTWLELGVTHIDWLEMSKTTFLGDSGTLVPGPAYYAIQLTHAMAGVGDQLVSSTSDVSTLRPHAAVRQDGKLGVMLLNEDLTNSLTVNVSIPNVSLAGTGIKYQFGTNNFNGGSLTPFSAPSSNSVAGLGNSFSVTVPAYTMVVLAIPMIAAPTNTPPVLAAISDQTVNVGQPVAFTASAMDTGSPPQTLAFTLIAGAAGATLGTNSGAFYWRPAVPQADSTNTFTLQVADSGPPNLSATQSFSVTVNPLVLPGFTDLALTGGQFGFNVTGTSGPDYEIQTSTNLTQWSAVFITNSPVLPFHWIDRVTNAPLRFYRMVVGPPLPQ